MEPTFKVLLVEDISMIRTLIRHQLAELGITHVVMAADGAGALDLLIKEPDVDLILCDWHMAPMDGLTFCAQVQTTPHLGGRRIPVLFMTSDERLTDPVKRKRALEQARDLCIVDILIKPFETADLRSALVRCASFSAPAA